MTTCCRLFRRLEDHFLGESEHHGVGGGWRIEAPRLSWAILDAVGDAAEEMGIKRIPDFNTGDNEGIELFPRQPEARPALVVGARLPQAGAEPRQPAAGKERAGRPTDRRERPRRRRALHAGRRSRRGAHQRRSHPVRGLDRLDAGAASFRHRAGRLACAARHRYRARQARRRPQSAGPSAAARDLQGLWRAHAERDLLHADPARHDGARLRLPPARAADHGAVAARHLHPFRPASRARQHPVPRAAAVAGQVRRSAASLPGDHRQRLQSAADLARHRAHPLGQARRGAGDRAELSVDRRRPPGRRRRHPRHAAADEADSGWRRIARRNICPAPASATTTPRWQKPPAISAPRSSIPSAPRRWARRAIRWPSSTSGCASTASPACAWSMPR